MLVSLKDNAAPIGFGRAAVPTPSRQRAHVIVCGNEKGGSGKSTIAIHLATALLREGCTVATVDLDARQMTLTRYLQGRQRTSLRYGHAIRMPRHVRVETSNLSRREGAEQHEREELNQALEELSSSNDFVVVDTPGFDTNLSRAAHSNADTLVTPMNDSFIDYDVLARVGEADGDVPTPSQYALRVREARRTRLARSARMLDWTVVRNRLSPLTSSNERRVHESLRLLGMELGFRLVDGIAERVVFRELFRSGLTVVDDMDVAVAAGVEVDERRRDSWLKAAADIQSLVSALKLPIDHRRGERNEAREAWLADLAKPTTLPRAYTG